MAESNKFTYRAIIDWIEIEVETVSPSNFITIKSIVNPRDELIKPRYVNAMNKGLGSAATIFRFKYYDIQTWRELEDSLINLSFDKPLVNEPKVVGIEVSFDAKSKADSTDDLIAHTGEFVRMLSNPIVSTKNKRAVGGYKGSVEQLWLKKGSYRQAAVKSFCFQSQKDDDISMRIYWKHTDRRSELSIEEQVARVEVTLKNSDCPFNTIEEAKSYQFSELSKWFKFRKVKEGLDGLSQVIVDWERQVGERAKRSVRKGSNKKVSYRLYHSFTVSNTKLNRIAYDSLRQLTKRLNKTRPTQKMRLTH